MTVMNRSMDRDAAGGIATRFLPLNSRHRRFGKPKDEPSGKEGNEERSKV
jgi:hypothetical protein